MPGKALADKVWDSHVISRAESDLVYIDLHLTHEVTSPQPFEGLRLAGRKVRRPDLTLATSDHDVPTDGTPWDLLDSYAKRQLEYQVKNCQEFGITLYSLNSDLQGIVHVIGPEQGLSLPGMTIVCGDSHTSTHGAFGALAFGIGTSQVEHVLATQTLWMPKPQFSRVIVEGSTARCWAKDISLAILHATGTAGLAGTLVEFAGSAVRNLSMEGRMTVCNMAIESGSRAGMIAPDDTTFSYIEGRPFAPQGHAWEQALDYWRSIYSDPDASFVKEFVVDSSELVPRVTWGTNPAQNLPLTGRIPDPNDMADPQERMAAERALRYMDFEPGRLLKDVDIQRVFIGSCTNSRIEDLREAAAVLAGHTVNRHVEAMVVPGSMAVKAQAEQEGLDVIFNKAGISWRRAGCSMCIAMNGDAALQGEHVASTSNRNFESRQGPGGRTHLVSPAVAAASAVLGHLAEPADLGVSCAN